MWFPVQNAADAIGYGSRFVIGNLMLAAPIVSRHDWKRCQGDDMRIVIAGRPCELHGTTRCVATTLPDALLVFNGRER